MTRKLGPYASDDEWPDVNHELNKANRALALSHSRLAAVEAVAKLCEERAGTRWGVDPYSDAAARIRRALGDET